MQMYVTLEVAKSTKEIRPYDFSLLRQPAKLLLHCVCTYFICINLDHHTMQYMCAIAKPAGSLRDDSSSVWCGRNVSITIVQDADRL